jgi:acyl-CoA thioester hydrolase
MFASTYKVDPSWIDSNGHMNVRRYFDVFSEAGDAALRELGLGQSYMAGGHSIFTGDFHITYVREVLAGGSLTVASRIVELDAKRFVFHQEMIDDRTGELAATAEQLQLNVGVASRRVEPFRSEVLERLHEEQRDLDSSKLRNVGRAASLTAGAPGR